MKIFKFFAGLVSILLIALVVIWFNLDILVNAKNLGKLQRYFAPQLAMEWDRYKLSVKNDGAFAKTIGIATQGSNCIVYKKTEVCIDELTVNTSVDFWDWRESILEKLVVHISRAEINLSDFINNSQESDPLNIHSNLLMVRDSLRMLIHEIPKRLDVKIHDTHFAELNSDLTVTANFEKVEAQWSSKDLKADLQSEFAAQDAHLKNSGRLQLQSKTFDYGIQWKGAFEDVLQGELRVEIEDQKKKDKSSTFDFRKVQATIGVEILDAHSDLVVKKISVVPRFGLESISGELCQIRFSENTPMSSSLKCDSLKLVNPDWSKLIGQKQFRDQVPPVLAINLNVNFSEGRFSNRVSDQFSTIDLQLTEVSNKNFALKAKTQISLKFLNEKMVWDIDAASASLKVQSFQYIVGLMEKTKFPVPAPLNSLEGQVDFSLNDAKTLEQGITLNTKGEIRLAGEGSQKTNVDLTATIDISRKGTVNYIAFDGNVLIRDLHLYLPPLDPLVEIPKISRDPRIGSVKEPEPSKKSNTLSYKLKITSQNSNSIRVYHKLFDPYLEGGLTVNLDSDQVRYRFTQANAFEIVYLKRRLRVEKLEVSHMDPRLDKLKLDINTLYQAAGYNISIDVIGTAEKPRLLLTSRPSLSREDIISVLLYNRTSQSLSRSENQNVGGTEAAIADRALGLLGIWAFASTPIESVSYNSRSQTYQAQIALPGEVKLSIGTDWEQSQFVGLRKRISENWILVTGYETGEEEQLGNLFLEREFYY